MKYKHYSFDLWGTLIKGNPYFKLKRTEFFHEYMNMKEVDLGYVKHVFAEVDVMINYVNEVCGGNITSEEMYAMILHKLGWKVEDVTEEIMTGISKGMSEMFLKYPPTIIDGVVETLTSLRERGCTLSILSNTGFIKGETVRKFLDTTPLKDMFDFMIFSDEMKCSKPSKALYSYMDTGIFSIPAILFLSDILHVGDNPLADVKGAQSFGIDALLINNSLTDKTIKDVLTYNALPSILG